jgi:hypothetical protein
MKKAIFYFYENKVRLLIKLKANTVKYLFNSNGLNVQVKENDFFMMYKKLKN